MKRLMAGIAIVLAASGRSQADGRPALVGPAPNVQATGGPAKAGDAAVEEEPDRWLKLKRGTRVRLMVEDRGPMREVVGRLQASDSTTVTVDTAGGPQRLSRDRLFHLEYRTAHRDRLKGAAIGATITGLAGTAACVVAIVNEAKKNNGHCGQCVIVLPVCGIGGAIPGGAIGFTIGTTGGVWHSVTPKALTVIGAASPRRATVALQLRVGH